LGCLIDTHCHLDAVSLAPTSLLLELEEATKGVAHCVIPAVEVANFDTVRTLAHALGYSYGLGIHPLVVERTSEDDLSLLKSMLEKYQYDPRLVGIGEIGLDGFYGFGNVISEKQEFFFREQLKIARELDLPVMLHVRRAVDKVLKHLRDIPVRGGIAHAFNGSLQQAHHFMQRGFKLGFGGAVTYQRARHLRELVQTLPLDALVLETDAPDMPPHWLYVTAEQRATGIVPPDNIPAELPRIAALIADLRSITPEALAQATTQNATVALPKLGAMLV
jgi:TatD DNase family protein